MISDRLPVVIEGPVVDPSNSTVVATVLHALPDWFGIEEAVTGYRDEAAALPVLVARAAGQPVGCLALKQHSPYAAEVHVMGVLPEYHRGGAGAAGAGRSLAARCRGGVPAGEDAGALPP